MTLPPSGPISGTTLFDRSQNFRVSRGQAARWAFSIKTPDGTAADLDGRVFTWRLFRDGDEIDAFGGVLSNDRRSVDFVLASSDTASLQNGLRHRLDEETSDGPVPWLEGWVRVRAGTAAPLGSSNGPIETITRAVTTETVAIQSKGAPGEKPGEQLKRALEAAGRGDEMPDDSDAAFLAFVDKVAATLAARKVGSAGLISGGGALSGDLQLKVEAASDDEAIAGTIATKAVTPTSLRAALLSTTSDVLDYTEAMQVRASGLITGGGRIGDDPTLTVEAASDEDAIAGIRTDRALTPKASKAALDTAVRPFAEASGKTFTEVIASALPLAAMLLTLSGATTPGDRWAGQTFVRDDSAPEGRPGTFRDPDGKGYRLVNAALHVANAISYVPPAERAAILAGTSTYDATADLQAAIDSGAATVIVEGTWNVSRPVLRNKTGFELIGLGGATFKIIGVAPKNPDGSFALKNGIQLDGQLNRVTVAGFRIVMSSVLSDGHIGVWSNSSQNPSFRFLTLQDIETFDGIGGLSVNTNLTGSQFGTKFIRCRSYRARGIESGYGYGLHLADGSGLYIDALFEDCYVKEAERHGIYVARGIGIKLVRPHLVRHRIAIKGGLFRAALNVIRCSHVEIDGGIFENCYDCALYLGKSATNGDVLTVTNTKFIWSGADNTVPQVNIGSIDPNNPNTDTTPNAPDGAPTTVSVSGLKFYADGSPADCIRMNCARGLRIRDVTGYRRNWDGSATCINYIGNGGDMWNDDIDVDTVTFDQDRTSPTATITGQVSLLRFGASGLAHKLRLANMSGRCDRSFSGASIDNPNLSIFNIEVPLTQFAAGFYPKGKFSFTHRIAAIAFAQIAAQGGDSYNFSVPLLKAGTPVKLSLVSIGAANTLLSYVANVNNNVRMVRFNRDPVGSNPVGAFTSDVIIGVDVDIK